MAQKIEYPKNLAPKVDDLAPEPQGEPTDARWCGLEIGAAEAAEQGEVAWEIGYQLLDPDGNSVGVGWPFPSVAEADESGARRAREESDSDPMWPTAHRVVRRRVAGEWLPVEQEGGV